MKIIRLTLASLLFLVASCTKDKLTSDCACEVTIGIPPLTLDSGARTEPQELVIETSEGQTCEELFANPPNEVSVVGSVGNESELFYIPLSDVTGFERSNATCLD